MQPRQNHKGGSTRIHRSSHSAQCWSWSRTVPVGEIPHSGRLRFIRRHPGRDDLHPALLMARFGDIDPVH